MNQIILMKDIRLMLKDLKFQIFFLILVALFILSAISSAVTYHSHNDEYQADLNRFNELVSNENYTKLANLINHRRLNVLSQPSPAILFSSYSSFPDKINSRVIFYSPTLDKYGQSGNGVFRLNWFFILGILTGFIMLVMSFETISQEKRSGTLRLMSVYGFKRQKILWIKYISYMLLYLIIIIPPALASMILFFALTGTWSAVFMWKFLLILLISIPFASFFVWLGIFISMGKNYRNAIVMIVFIWLFFVIIVPQSASIFGKQLSPIKTTTEYRQARSSAFWDEFQAWNEREDDRAGSNTPENLEIRAAAYHTSEEKRDVVVQKEVEDYMRQTMMIQKIASISPFAQFEMISEIVFDKGLYMLNYMQDTTKRSVNQITNLMIEQDSRDENSMHLFYGWAEMDSNVLSFFYGSDKVAFSHELFEQPNLLFVTEIETDDAWGKMVKIMMRLLPILILNLVLMAGAVVKFERLDIR
ncbi:MAG: ABC transporter permease [Candidatus Cloacimonetes bacterium]|nr:ABC transporter permease [Candidatus Cloacimonadota bacterium]